MIIAALILSVLSLILSMACVIYLGAKHFSSHSVQLVPVDNYAPLGKPMADPYTEIGADIPDEKIFPV